MFGAIWRMVCHSLCCGSLLRGMLTSSQCNICTLSVYVHLGGWIGNGGVSSSGFAKNISL